MDRMWSRLFFLLSLVVIFPVLSCSRDDFLDFDIEPVLSDTLSYVEYNYPPYSEWSLSSSISISQFASLSFSHQSAARFSDYVFFVTKGRSKIGLFSLTEKKMIYIRDLKGVNGDTYHCNQSTFGIEKFEDSDFFPLLYISQRAKSDGRCFIEVYRVFPLNNDNSSLFESFNVELVQTIYLPKMTYDNSLGNANCVIDASSQTMYTYSRNNNKIEDNFGQCKITQFPIPDIHQETVVMNDEDILSSYMIDASAVNMQGGCIQDGVLYIGQGYASAGYIYLNIIDLEKKELVRRFDLQEYKFFWEPEGCFFYDDCVMLAHTAGICRIDKR